ncbi:MAG: spore coat associated protein CotJA [Clostridia bacterium]|nr:spore coat associated protein CotJA [Clostridia bacterium]
MNMQNFTPRCDGSVTDGYGNKCLDGMSLAMVYSPCQEFDGLFAVEEALGHGTLFMELEKPFYGARRLK